MDRERGNPIREPMQLSVNGKQLDVGDAFRHYVGGELPTIVAKYFENATDAQVTLSRETHAFRADIQVHVGRGIVVRGHALGADAHAAFDAAAEHVAKRLRRYKRRLHDHHSRRMGKEQAERALQYVLQAESEEAPEPEVSGEAHPLVIAEMETPLEELSVSEAVMRMDLGGTPALLFRNSAHGGLNMVYRREDGNVGWVDPHSGRGPDGRRG